MVSAGVIAGPSTGGSRSASRRCPPPLQPTIQELKQLIESDATIYMGFQQMFEQVPAEPPYNSDPDARPQVQDYKMMLALLNVVLREAPTFHHNHFSPIETILDWPMGTSAGFAMFTNDKVNAQFKIVIDAWHGFLATSESLYILNNNENECSWFSPKARKAMPNFTETYVCDPEKPYLGYKSWDAFFTRALRPGVRPVASPDDDSRITNPCESTVYAIARDVKERDAFWMKGQPYSLADMLAHDASAFLSTAKYHRWHSPVTGTVERVVTVPGKYFVEAPSDTAEGSNDSQAFWTSMATRTLIFIRADYEPIGLMCFVGVGMYGVATCEVTLDAGQRVKKGDQLGIFHFGGSTYCLVFRPETRLETRFS
ncbi:phosphatidylserine decarboxylase-like protein [Fomes fomentarius]|nr:phosphatidylserine decarboxylase-like protein [Fomes fomentarius]